MSRPDASARISVAIPTYNYGRFLPDTIESVVGQTFGDFELVVSDNCSADGTREIIEDYVRQDPRIRYFRNERNVGMVGNWNLCLERSTGTYVKILCADDLLEPTCLERSVAAMDGHPGAAMVCTGRTLVDSRMAAIGTVSYSNRFEALDGKAVIEECLLKGNLIGEPTAVLFRREFARRGFREAYRQLSDLEMWFHLLEQGDLVSLPEPLCRFRQHEGQETKINRRSLAFADDEFLIYRSYIRKPYVRYSFIQRLGIRFAKAMQVWDTRREGVAVAAVHAKISEHFNVALFHMLRLAYNARKLAASPRLRTP